MKSTSSSTVREYGILDAISNASVKANYNKATSSSVPIPSSPPSKKKGVESVCKKDVNNRRPSVNSPPIGTTSKWILAGDGWGNPASNEISSHRVLF